MNSGSKNQSLLRTFQNTTTASSDAVLLSKKDAHTYAVLEALNRRDATEIDTKLVEKWFSTLLTRNAPMTMLEHTALLIMHRSSSKSQYLSPASRALFDITFELSWDHLTAETTAPSWPVNLHRAEATLPYLPRTVRMRATEETRVIYDTVYFANERRNLLFTSLNTSSHRVGFAGGFKIILNRITSSSFFNLNFALSWLVLIGLLFIPYIRELVLGAIVGMIGASINEYAVHLGIGHSSPRLAKGFRKIGLFGLWAEEINLAHRVHHSKMIVDFRSEFSNEKVLNRVDAYLATEATKMVNSRVEHGQTAAKDTESEISRIISQIKAAGYGVDGTILGCVSMHVIAIPFFILNVILFSALGAGLAAGIFLFSATFFLSGFITQSMYSHRYLHMTPGDLVDPKLAGTTTSFMRWYMTTAAGQLQTRRHYRHHQEKFDYQKTVNGVIMAYSFADFILRRGVSEAELTHILRMRKEGFFNYSESL
jgi:hypothetical protein